MTAALSPVEVEERLDLRRGCVSTQAATVSLVLSVRSAGRPRVADQAGRAADQRERPVAGLLEAPGGEHLDEVAEVQAGRVGSKPT